MRKNCLLLLLLLAGCSSPDSIEISTDTGKMILTPMADNAIRVRYDDARELEELFYTQKREKTDYKVTENESTLSVIQKGLTTIYYKNSGKLEYFTPDGGKLFREENRSGNSATFLGPNDEHLYGLGQFQDGYFDIKGLSRRLTQVNTQISIPFIMSSAGYGLLWNNYGMTEFNPCSDSIPLTETNTSDDFAIVNATGTSGNKSEKRYYETFTGTIDLEEEGCYSILLDVGQSMGRKHWLTIDGKILTDCDNLWLPPTTSVKVELEAGRHDVEVRGVRGDSPVIYWRRDDSSTTLCSPNQGRMDYTVFAGSADEVIASYRKLTGEAPRMPSWMLGYIHCRERYNTQAELLENARTFKDKDIPVDVIVQDWQWWGKYGWNSMRFDEEKYPDPAGMVDSLHSMGMKLMVSVWSKVDRGSVLGKALDQRECYIEDTEWIDYFKPEAADFYWTNFRDSLVRHGIDAWWFDATEPENDDLAGRYEQYRNVYPLKVLQTVYEGLKNVHPEEEPVILTLLDICRPLGVAGVGAALVQEYALYDAVLLCEARHIYKAPVWVVVVCGEHRNHPIRGLVGRIIGDSVLHERINAAAAYCDVDDADAHIFRKVLHQVAAEIVRRRKAGAFAAERGSCGVPMAHHASC